MKVKALAALAAFGGVKALHHHGYELPDTTAGEGHALAILKLTGELGTIYMTVSGENLKDVTIEL